MGARIREYLAAQGTNRRSHGLGAADLGSIPLEIEIRNVVTRDELPQLGAELLKKFNDDVKGSGGRLIGFAEDRGACVNVTETTFFDFLRNRFAIHRLLF